MDITGKIIFVGAKRSGTSKTTGNPWSSQDYVIETSEQYPRKCVFTVFGEDKINQFNIKEGGTYTVSFDIDAHEWNGRWFNDIRAWRVTPAVIGSGAAAASQPAAGAAPAASAAMDNDPFGGAQTSAPSDAGETSAEDDLPF